MTTSQRTSRPKPPSRRRARPEEPWQARGWADATYNHVAPCSTFAESRRPVAGTRALFPTSVRIYSMCAVTRVQLSVQLCLYATILSPICLLEVS